MAIQINPDPTKAQAFKDALKGPVDRSLVKVEVYFTGDVRTVDFKGTTGWQDITPYVLEMSGAMEELSSVSGGASANTLNLTLINDDGRFSPKNTAGPYYGNLTPNKPIRVSSVYGGDSVRMFTGYISNWIPSAKQRNCQVTAEDAARILRRKDIVEETVFDPIAPTTGYYLTRVLERAAYLSGLRWDAVTTKTAAWTLLDQDGDSVNEVTATYDANAVRATYTQGGALVMTLDLVDLLMPVTTLKGKCLAVFDQLAKVVDGVVYFDAQGQLVFRCRMYRNDSSLTSVETFTVSSLEDVTAQANFEDAKWSQLCNKATVKSTPWAFKVDASGNVVEEEIDFKGDLFAKSYFNPGERFPDYVADSGSADLYCELPSGIKLFKTSTYPTTSSMILQSRLTSDATSDAKGIVFQSGYPVFEQTRIKLALVNNGSAAEQISALKIKAKLMRPVQRCSGVYKNQASIDLYDQRDKEVSNDLIPNVSACKNLSAWLVEDGREPKDYYTLPVMYGCPWIELGDKITVSETITNTIPDATIAIVRRITWRMSLAAFVFTIEACTPSPTFTVSALPVTVTKIETSNQNHRGDNVGDKPFSLIDKTGSLVGLNNIPAFRNLIEATQTIAYGTTEAFHETAIGGGFVWAVSNTGKVYKIAPYNGNEVANYNLGTYQLRRCDWINDTLWVLSQDSNAQNPTLHYVTSGGATGIKHTFALGTDAYVEYSAVLGTVVNGTKYLWVLVTRDPAGGWGAKLYRFSDLSTTAAAPDMTIDISIPGGEGGHAGMDLAFDGTYVYVLLNLWAGQQEQVRRVVPSTGSHIYLANITQASDYVGVSHDGQYLYVLGYDAAASGYRIYKYQVDNNPVPGTVRIQGQSGVLSSWMCRMAYDGEHLLVASIGAVHQVDPATLNLIASYTTGATNSSQSGIKPTFDGTAIWTSLKTTKLARVPKLSASR